MADREAPPLLRRRTQGRTLALQALCIFEAVGDAFHEQLHDFLQDGQVHVEVGIEVPVDQQIVRFARSLADGAWRQRAALDSHIQKAAAHWALARMPPVDRNVLRLGVHELLEHPDTPPQVILNEAVDLARTFGDKDSAAFVNGVLDGVARELGLGPGIRRSRVDESGGE